MSWLDALERRFGSWTIPQFPLFIALANFAIYILNFSRPMFANQLLLVPEKVLAGEWWRAVTFLFVPPPWSPLAAILWFFLLYQTAQALEQVWGEFRFCFFYLVGAAAAVAASLIFHVTILNTMLNMSLLLAFATLFPEMEVLLFLIIPVRVKYLGWFMWVSMGASLVTGSFSDRLAIAASLVNYFLFFGPTLWIRAKLRVDVYFNRKRFKE